MQFYISLLNLKEIVFVRTWKGLHANKSEILKTNAGLFILIVAFLEYEYDFWFDLYVHRLSNVYHLSSLFFSDLNARK